MSELRNYPVKYVEGLETRNKVLEDVLEATKSAIQDELEQGHDLHDLTPLWADVDKTIAAADKE